MLICCIRHLPAPLPRIFLAPPSLSSHTRRSIMRKAGLVIIVGLLLISTGRAQAAEVYTSTRTSAVAAFSSANGCVATSVDVGATDGRDKNLVASRDAFSFISVAVTQYDMCA